MLEVRADNERLDRVARRRNFSKKRHKRLRDSSIDVNGLHALVSGAAPELKPLDGKKREEHRMPQKNESLDHTHTHVTIPNV